MTCPYCTYTFPLTWPRYFKSPTGRHVCPRCLKPSQLKFRWWTFSILLMVCLVGSLPGAVLFNAWLGPGWRWLGVFPSLIVVLPLARMFDDRYKELTALEAEAGSDTAVCAECKGVFNVQDMIAHRGLHVCARCKPVFLQKLSEGARIGPGPTPGKP